MMHHQMRFIFICSFLCVTFAATNDFIDIPKESQQSTVELVSDDVSSSSDVAGIPFETSHKSPYHDEFQTSHKIPDTLQRREDLLQSMKSKEKPELDDQLGELIAADIKSNIEAKRLSEYEKYVIEPLTTEKPVLATTEEGIAQSINEGLIDDFSILEEAGTENKQQSRIQIKKGPNGQDYEYEYVYYYYDDDEKNPEDSDVIVANKKSPSTSSTTTTTEAPESVNGGKISYTSIERGSSSGERNEIQSRGKGRAHQTQAAPAPVVEEITDDRLPPATRFPQRGKSVNPASVENAAPESGKKHHPKRPSLELVDSSSFKTDEKDKNSQKGPRIIETELSKSELLETVSKTSIEYSSSTVGAPTNDIEEEEEEDTTPSMEKATFDLYAHIANENANEDEKKTVSADIEATTIEIEDSTTEKDSDEIVESSPTTEATTTTTTEATTEKTTTTEKITTTTQEVTEAPRGRGGLTAGRNSNRFKFQGRSGPPSTTTTAAPESTEAPKGKGRFNKPSFSAGRSGGRTTKTTVAPVEENVEKTEAPQQAAAPANKFRSGGARNRFNLRNNAASPASTEKAAVNTEVETTTASRLVKPRPQFSLRNRSRSGTLPSSTEAPAQSDTETAVAETEQEKEENVVEKSSSSAPIVPRPTSRLNINRSGNRIVPTAGQRSRPSPLNRSRVNSNVENNEDDKSANENESDAESTTQNNLNKLKSRPRIQINTESKAKKTTAQPVINRKVNPLISKRKFGVTSTTEAAVDEHDENESDNATKEGAKDVSESVNELKEEETTQAVEVSSEQPRGLGLLNRRKLIASNRRPGTTN